MNLRDFRRAGHWPTLFCAFLYFDVSFMVWVLLGAVGVSVAADLRLSDLQKYFMVSVPLLAGSVLRVVLGLLTDHVGARRTALLGQTLTLVPLTLGWLWADSFDRVVLVGMMLGVAGASFAVALPLASRWYPPRYQGLALGIAGAGNSGTALATLFAPRLAGLYGWHHVFALALVPMGLTLLVFLCLARESPDRPAPKPLADYGRVLGVRDTWWFCLFYSVTFGGFVGLASFLNIFFHDTYGVSKEQAGLFTTLCVVSGSFLRPVGGHLADRLGGIRLLLVLYLGVGLAMTCMSFLPPLPLATLLLFAGMGLLGMGNGAVFQLVPLRFPKEIGVLTGVVGAAGGVGGFFLPNLLGNLKVLTGSIGSGFAVFAGMSVVCVVSLLGLRARWEAELLAPEGARPAGIVPATVSN